ncbi:MAG: hypothetical protein R3181_12920, partial [Rubricoccaceae bacterium]|nr:hypothetical protein [Rubricoccaceae bacterium]
TRDPAFGPSVAFGDEPPDADGEVRFDRVGLHAGVRSTGLVRGGLEGRYVRDTYSLPGLGAFAVEPERTISHAAAEGTLDVDGTTPAALRASVGHTSVSDDVLGDDATTNPAETRLAGSGHVEVLQRLVRLEGAVGASSFSSAASQDDLLDYEAGLVLQAHRRSGAQFALGARVLGYRVTDLVGGTTTTTVIAPVARVEVPLGLAARLFALTDPGLGRRGYADVFAENPYLVAPLLAPDVNTVDAQAGLEVRSGILGLRAHAGATFSPTRLLFARDAAGLYAAEYADARVLSLGGDVTVATASGVEATAGVAVRDGQLTEFDEAIPFFARTVGRAGLQVPFDGGRGRVGLAAYAEGSRPTTRSADGPTADGWATLSAYGTYALSGGLSLVLRGERLLGQAERWPGFPQVPFAVMAGVRYAR